MRSNFERIVASELDLAGVDYEYEPFELEFDTRIRNGWCPYCHSEEVFQRRKYTPDFYIEKHNVIIEAKGKFDQKGRSKMLDVIRDWPHLDIRMWFMYDNKLTKRSKVRYSDWCKKHGITYHCGKEAPPWLEELK